MRPQGWHLPEKHCGSTASRPRQPRRLPRCTWRPAASSRSTKDSGPTSTCPRWVPRGAAVERRLQPRPGLPGHPAQHDRATVLIETYPAAFEMEEILYELRDHSAGLNAGRWDYMFSVIKCFRTRGKDFPAPRPQLGDDDRAVHAGLHRAAGAHLPQARAHLRSAAWPPSSPARTPRSTRSRSPRSRTTRPARPTTGSTALGGPPRHGGGLPGPFTAVLGDRPNQLDKLREDVHVTAEQLLDVASTPGDVTEGGLRSNISVGIQYLESWLRGSGAVGINNLMEDAATAEISRSQMWQWLHNGVELAGGQTVTRELVERFIEEELAAIRDRIGDEAVHGPVGRRPSPVHRDGAGRRVSRVPHPARVRADAVTGHERDARHPRTAGPTAGDVTPEYTPATGESGDRQAALDVVTRLAREVIPEAGVITDHARLRTYECDGLAHYKVTPALVVIPEAPSSSPPWCGPAPSRDFRSWPGGRGPACCPAAPCPAPTGCSWSPRGCGRSGGTPRRPARRGGAGGDQPRRDPGGGAVRLLLRAGPLEPAGLLDRRQPRGELRWCPLPEVRLHHQPRDRRRAGHAGRRRRRAGWHGPGRPRLRPAGRRGRLRGHAGRGHGDHRPAGTQPRGGARCWPGSPPPTTPSAATSAIIATGIVPA